MFNVGDRVHIKGSHGTVVVAEPDENGCVVLMRAGGSDESTHYVVIYHENIALLVCTLAELPSFTDEAWTNVYPYGGRKPLHISAAEADGFASYDRIARVRLIPDPNGIVRCSGRHVFQ